MKRFRPTRFRYLVILIIGVIAFFVWKYHYHRIFLYEKTIKDVDQTYEMIDEMVKLGKTKVQYTSLVYPGFLEFDRVMEKAEGENIYTYCEFYGYEYQAYPAYGNYEVHLELKTPTKDYNKKTKKRVEQIADCYRNLDSDYEKIKAVHDYICENAKYNLIYGGAYSNLYRGESTCTGYAYSFYAIMKELGIGVTLEYSIDHVWNKVLLDGKWYNVDVTWDDGDDGNVYYDFFLKCDKDWVGHSHGGSDAETSYPLTGKDSRYYYRMVPNYRLQKNVIMYGSVILLILFFLFLISRMNSKKEKEYRKTAMKFGDWVFYHSTRDRNVHKVIIQQNKRLQRKERWEIEDGRYFHVVKENGGMPRRVEVPENEFISQLELVINAARSNRANSYMEEMLQIRESLR